MKRLASFVFSLSQPRLSERSISSTSLTLWAATGPAMMSAKYVTKEPAALQEEFGHRGLLLHRDELATASDDSIVR